MPKPEYRPIRGESPHASSESSEDLQSRSTQFHHANTFHATIDYVSLYRSRILLAILAALGGGILGFLITTTAATSPRWTHCGSSVEEAHARNCQYDVMIGSWLLPECSDRELMEDYLAARDWEFYRDENLTAAIPMDELRRGEHNYPVWATVHQHQHHCAYVWEKQFRAAVRGAKMDDLSASVPHTRHCAEALYSGMPGATESLALAVKYFSCVDAGSGDPKRPNNPNNKEVVMAHHKEEHSR